MVRGDKEISRELIKEEITKQLVTRVIAKGIKIAWHCVDATSYNKTHTTTNAPVALVKFVMFQVPNHAP